jgi:two-component system sensor histidine kinase HydH
MSAKSMMPETPATESEHFTFAGALLECMACGTIVLSPAGQILAFNESAEKVTRLKAAAVLGRPMSALPVELQSIISETLAKDRPTEDRDVQLASADGTILLQASTRIARQPDGSILSLTLEVRNIGQVRAIAANLEHLDRLANVGVLTAGVAHEIKNALVAVRTFVDLLIERTKDDELTQIVSREILRIERAVGQVLRDATREEFTMAPLNTHALLQDAVNLLRHELQARSIQLALNLAAPSDRVSGDERQLRHALLNLLINALEAMDTPGRLGVATEVSSTARRAHLQVTISDTGSGISPEHLPRLFSPFFTTKRDGTGLGLAITRRIIQRHEGTITVESQVNKGTTFQVCLPLI